MSVRASSTVSSEETGGPSDPLYNRFKAWRSVIGNLIEFFEQLESIQKTQCKEFTKLSKTLEVPFKTPEFAPDGIATIWQAMRDKATQLANFHNEEATLIKGGPIADLTRLRGDLKKHLSDLEKEGVQGSKKVGKRMDKFSDTTQSLGKWIPIAEMNPTSLDAHHDPYVLWRQIRHKLYRAVDEENVLNEQLLALQRRCEHYETVIVQAIQRAMKDHAEQVSKESQYSLTIANEVNAIAMRVPPGKEWQAFTYREPSLLKPDHRPRDPATVPFPFSDHKLVKPVLEATLARKSTVLKRRNTSYYVLSAAGFLLEYKDRDPITNPDPTLSLRLADCELGNSPARSGKAEFILRGKDAGKSFGGRTHEYNFQTDSVEQGIQWWKKLEQFAGGAPPPAVSGSVTNSEGEESPVSEKRQSSPVPAPEYTARVHTAPQTATTEGAVEQQSITAGPQRTTSIDKPTTGTPVTASPTAAAYPTGPPSPIATAIASPTAASPTAASPTAASPTTASPTRSPALAAAYAATHPTSQP